ncbi:MAG TPA: maleylpyruvate isomerase N-terminal domain-containing protein, partial [Candidatus Limnocylindrales bacterium]
VRCVGAPSPGHGELLGQGDPAVARVRAPRVTAEPRYHRRMYEDGFSFLEEERDAWRPFEALLELTDEELERPLDGAHGWSGRDLMAHLGIWIEWWLNIARELAVGPNSEAYDRLRAISDDWANQGDVLNAQYQAEWAALPMAELRSRFSTLPGELRGYLTVVPETRWLKESAHLKSLLGNTTEHYADHLAELQTITAAAGR